MTNDNTFPPILLDRIQRAAVIAVVTVDQADDAVPLAQALLSGGIDTIELTLRTPAALEAIRLVKTEAPKMLLGAGTVLTPGQVADVAAAGADFAVAPGMNPRVVLAARDRRLPFAPGVATPTEIEQAIECGCRLLKFFPAEPLGGLAYLKVIAAPYAHLGLQYIAMGSLDVPKAIAYLEEPIVSAVGVAWVAPRELIAKREWNTIQENAREAVRTVRQRAV